MTSTFLLSALNFLVVFNFHPYHVSVCEIEYKSIEQTLQVTHRIFIDDLEAALRDQHQEEWFDIVNPQNEQQRDTWIKEYVSQRFSIRLNNDLIKGNYLGHEFEYDVIFCYIEYSDCIEIKNIEVTNTILLDQFEDQTNLVHVTFNDNVKSLKLEPRKPKGTLEFK